MRWFNFLRRRSFTPEDRASGSVKRNLLQFLAREAGKKNSISPNARRRVACGQRCLPKNIRGGTEISRRLRAFADAQAVRPAKLRPVRGGAGERDDQHEPSNGIESFHQSS